MKKKKPNLGLLTKKLTEIERDEVLVRIMLSLEDMMMERARANEITRDIFEFVKVFAPQPPTKNTN